MQPLRRTSRLRRTVAILSLLSLPVALVTGGRFGQLGAHEYEQQALRFSLLAGGMQQLLEIVHHHEGCHTPAARKAACCHNACRAGPNAIDLSHAHGTEGRVLWQSFQQARVSGPFRAQARRWRRGWLTQAT